MKTLYSINDNYKPDPRSDCLLLEAGNGFLSFGVINTKEKKLFRFEHYIADRINEDIFTPCTETHPDWYNTDYAHAFSFFTDKNLLVPSSFYHDGVATAASAVYGQKQKQDYINTLKLYNIYCIPEKISNKMMLLPPKAELWHFFSVCLNKASHSTADVFYLEFRSQEFFITFFSKTGLQLCQSYNYSAPQDVLYYLLKICECFSVHRAGLNLILSGFIENKSTIYHELSKYFLNIRFSSLPESVTADPAFAEYPAHYFSSICNLATCVS